MAQERLQKLLARAGVTSRRKAEELIKGGRVRVDGRIVTELGSKADIHAKIEFDGQRLSAERLCYGILHKPRQMMTTLSDPEGRATIQDILRKVGLRVVPVGRLDFNTSGALLFTNDGDFAQVLGHPKSSAPKIYIAKVRGELDEKNVAKFRESIDIEGKMTRPAEVRILRRENGSTWLEFTLSEGRNRQIRRLGEHAHATVSRLARLSHAGITTDGLRLGEYRLLTPEELAELKAKYGVPKKIRGAMTAVELEELPKKRPNYGRPGAKKAAKGGGERRGRLGFESESEEKKSSRVRKEAPRSTSSARVSPGAKSSRGFGTKKRASDEFELARDEYLSRSASKVEAIRGRAEKPSSFARSSGEKISARPEKSKGRSFASKAGGDVRGGTKKETPRGSARRPSGSGDSRSSKPEGRGRESSPRRGKRS